MGTRGLWGFVVGGKEKLTYNHCDSYPDGLGKGLLKELAERQKVSGWRERLWKEAEDLRLVDRGSKPTPEDIKNLSSYADTGVSSQRLDEWYVLLRHTQGSLEETLDAGVMIDSHEFAGDSVFCEWGYVIDLDAGRFEVYKGFQDEPHTEGRFHALPPNEEGRETRYPIRLVASWPLDQVPYAWIDIVEPPDPEEVAS